MDAKECIVRGETALGIEFGSTNIKAVLTDKKGTVLATGNHGWENTLKNGIWTYPLTEIHEGLQDCYRSLAALVEEK